MASSDSIVMQSGAICYRLQNGAFQTLLVTSSKGDMWVIPKGHLEPDITEAQNAAKEAWEEAGVEGEITGEAIGAFSYERKGKTYCVNVYPLLVTAFHDDWEEDHVREREWVDLDEARKRLVNDDLREMVRQLAERKPVS